MATSSHHHVLLLGGHGRVAQILTPLLLKRSWTVTSVIRVDEQIPTIEKLGAGLPGKLHVLARSIEEISSQEEAASLLDEVKPDYVAWSAGAGGKGAPERTFKIDRDAAIHFINAATASLSISRFLLVSYIGARRSGAAWWPSDLWDEYYEKVTDNGQGRYYQAKLAADEALYEATKKRPSLVGIDLRPGALTDDSIGQVSLGKTSVVRGRVSRESVAHVADRLLAAEGVQSGWLDLLAGDDEIDVAIEKVIRDAVDTAEGEPIYKL
ncbi:hypothetical protein PT974_10978 [Cladobotryum mycophilum]|uniref:NAD(P)-binding domain-containing protein n=1 Tax=Cladobotryum mycophilum TaxID=491253 RepID=A0ABR0SBA4_9HYPO